MKTILNFLTQLIHFIATPEYDVPILCSLETQQKAYQQYFTVSEQRAHSGYEKSTAIWREHRSEPN